MFNYKHSNRFISMESVRRLFLSSVYWGFKGPLNSSNSSRVQNMTDPLFRAARCWTFTTRCDEREYFGNQDDIIHSNCIKYSSNQRAHVPYKSFILVVSLNTKISYIVVNSINLYFIYIFRYDQLIMFYVRSSEEILHSTVLKIKRNGIKLLLQRCFG